LEEPEEIEECYEALNNIDIKIILLFSPTPKICLLLLRKKRTRKESRT